MSTFRDAAVKQEDQEVSAETAYAAKQRIGTSRARLLLQQPFYGVVLSMMDFIPENAIPTMATDGAKVYYNPNFTMALTEDETYGVLLHEISHCIYQHCTQKRRLNRAHRRWNVASDFAINLEIKDMGYALPKDVLYDTKYREMNAEQIYDSLTDEQAEKMQTLDMHIDNSDESSWDDMEDKIITAYEMTKNQKGRGNMPGGLKRWIDKLRKNRVKWERIFHKYVGQALAKDDYSYTRVNKRFLGQGIYLPDLRSNMIGNVVIAIDTSGSIGRNFLEQVASEIDKISHLVSEITCITCDATIQEVVKIREFGSWLKTLQFKGGGGTSFIPPINYVKEKNLQIDLFIYLTDGYGDWDSIKRPQYPVLWVLAGEECPKPPWGQHVVVPSDKNGRDW